MLPLSLQKNKGGDKLMTSNTERKACQNISAFDI